jgi:A/G-specific adenine glycosylase
MRGHWPHHPEAGIIPPIMADSSIPNTGALVAWFEANRESLPWRANRTPYTVWISEIMLQQTQVATVAPYFERFLARFPDARTLAEAPLDDVLKLWEGLGYYSRARNLHRAARVLVEEHGGELPSDPDALRRLPGIGPYTANAIASLAFGVDVPVLDGNVMRVLTRLHDISDDIRLPETRQALWRIAGELVPAGHAAAWNEGLMELGRRVCTPKAPRCEECPLAADCRARAKGIQTERPVRSKKARPPHHVVTAAVILRGDGDVLITRRPHDKMLGGLWEFPGGKCVAGETLQECLQREIREELGVEIAVGGQLARIKHAYTHFRITLYAFMCTLVAGEPQTLGCADFAWVALDALDRYAFPTTDRKIIAALMDARGWGSQSGR